MNVHLHFLLMFWGGKYAPIKGLYAQAIISKGVENYVSFIEELADEGYINSDYNNKLAFARDLMGIQLEDEFYSPIEKVQWLGLHGDGMNKDFYYMISYLTYDGQSGAIPASKKRFLLNETNLDKENHQESSYAKHATQTIRDIMAKYYEKDENGKIIIMN